MVGGAAQVLPRGSDKPPSHGATLLMFLGISSTVYCIYDRIFHWLSGD